VSWLSDKVLPRGEAEAFLRMRTSWQGQQNLFSVSGSFLGPSHWGGVPDHTGKVLPRGFEPDRPIKTLTQWREFWGPTETGSIEGRGRYQGVNVRSKLHGSPEKVTPDDFRLRPESAGYRAGKDKKDLGADVDLVGPGKAYERWKKTPEYQQWLKDTGQAKK